MTNVEFLKDVARQLTDSMARPPGMSDDVPARLRKVAKLLLELDERDTVLTALENGGVDNWDWYGASLKDAGL